MWVFRLNVVSLPTLRVTRSATRTCARSCNSSEALLTRSGLASLKKKHFFIRQSFFLSSPFGRKRTKAFIGPSPFFFFLGNSRVFGWEMHRIFLRFSTFVHSSAVLRLFNKHAVKDTNDPPTNILYVYTLQNIYQIFNIL